MDKPVVSPALWERIDSLLAQSNGMDALKLYREATRCSIVEGKDVIGTRFRERFPDLWASYRDVDDAEDDAK